VNRYRDSFANIRTDCVHELGLWIETHPEHFLDNNFLKFLGWALYDKEPKTRKESIDVIRRLYQKEAFAVSLENLTTRFRPRLISMLNDVEKDIRGVALSLSVKLLE
jgi:cohesin complex subunit SA-1/2